MRARAAQDLRHHVRAVGLVVARDPADAHLGEGIGASVRAQAVDVAPNSMIIQSVADEERNNALIENLQPFGIRELTRTGRVAMVRGAKTTAVHEHESAELQRFHHESGRLPEGELPFVSD